MESNPEGASISAVPTEKRGFRLPRISISLPFMGKKEEVPTTLPTDSPQLTDIAPAVDSGSPIAAVEATPAPSTTVEAAASAATQPDANNALADLNAQMKTQVNAPMPGAIAPAPTIEAVSTPPTTTPEPPASEPPKAA